jgi:hypothetical protein
MRINMRVYVCILNFKTRTGKIKENFTSIFDGKQLSS